MPPKNWMIAAPGADAHGPRERIPSTVVDQVRSVDGVDAVVALHFVRDIGDG